MGEALGKPTLNSSYKASTSQRYIWAHANPFKTHTHLWSNIHKKVRQAPPTQKINWFKYSFDNGRGREQAETEQLAHIPFILRLCKFPKSSGNLCTTWLIQHKKCAKHSPPLKKNPLLEEIYKKSVRTGPRLQITTFSRHEFCLQFYIQWRIALWLLLKRSFDWNTVLTMGEVVSKPKLNSSHSKNQLI